MESFDRDRVDFVLPVYNKAHVLRATIERLAEALAGCQRRPWQSSSWTTGPTTARGHSAGNWPRITSCSLCTWKRRDAARLRRTWSETDAEFSIYMDVDLSTGLEAVPPVVEALEEGADVVTGSRLHRNAHTTRCLKREVISRSYNQLVRRVLRTCAFDNAQCGFKGVCVRSIRPLLPLVKNEDWFFDTELLVLAEYAGLTVRSLPVRWIEDPDTRVHIAKTVWQDLKGLARMWWTGRRVARSWQRDRRESKSATESSRRAEWRHAGLERTTAERSAR